MESGQKRGMIDFGEPDGQTDLRQKLDDVFRQTKKVA
jgi:hypothetical protein